MAGCWDNGITIYFRNKAQRELEKHQCLCPRVKWSQGCSIWRVILCHPAANYSLDSTGKPLLVSVHHVVEENSLSGKPKILGIAPDLGHVASRVTPEQERNSSAAQGLPHALGFFRNRPRQFMILLSRQERKVWEEPLTPAEDRQASWQRFPAHIPGQREADGQAFRALA